MKISLSDDRLKDGDLFDDLPALSTPAELAALMRTTAAVLAQDRYLGRGVPFIRHGRKILYARDDIAAYLQQNRVGGAA